MKPFEEIIKEKAKEVFSSFEEKPLSQDFMQTLAVYFRDELEMLNLEYEKERESLD